jgi:hypothetical protein
MIHHLPTHEYSGLHDPMHLLLMSDMHIGARTCDLARIRSDLDWAKEHNARVLICGDVFDMIIPKDVKRYHPSVITKAVAGIDDLVNAVKDMAVELLGPYAGLVWVIGCGNHESKAIKYHATDIIRLLLEKLEPKAGHEIYHGGYTGGIIQPFRKARGGGAHFRIWYHHGWGGSAPVSLGLIDFNRAAAMVGGADVIWMGHKHTKMAVETHVYEFGLFGAEFNDRTRWYLRTGAYSESWAEFRKVCGKKKHRDYYKADWATEQGFAPQGRGGIRLTISPVYDSRVNRVVCRTKVVMEG